MTYIFPEVRTGKEKKKIFSANNITDDDCDDDDDDNDDDDDTKAILFEQKFSLAVPLIKLFCSFHLTG